MTVRHISGIIEGEPPTTTPCKIYLTVASSDYDNLKDSLGGYRGFTPLFENAYAKKVSLYLSKTACMPTLVRGGRYDVDYIIMRRKVHQQYSKAAAAATTAAASDGSTLSTDNHAITAYAGDGIHLSLSFVIQSIRPAEAEANLRVAAGVAILDMSK